MLSSGEFTPSPPRVPAARPSSVSPTIAAGSGPVPEDAVSLQEGGGSFYDNTLREVWINGCKYSRGLGPDGRISYLIKMVGILNSGRQVAPGTPNDKTGTGHGRTGKAVRYSISFPGNMCNFCFQIQGFHCNVMHDTTEIPLAGDLIGNQLKEIEGVSLHQNFRNTLTAANGEAIVECHSFSCKT
ncbi:hypothetical protein Taro_008194 [Colocasia esculenta]|uniref:Uncharacterized protein n=1 Tax=Colocasia esculenta TaxID=4460 RepID=A0A843TT66_COLES|nr:hypothetical protein [Colocasia esculenta]